MSDSSDIPHLLTRFWSVPRPETVESLGGAGGFSGAKFWRVQTRIGNLCLRRWPTEHPSRQRLVWIHRILQHAFSQGIACLPVPLLTGQQQTFASHAGYFWELTPWLTGQADYRVRPTDAKLRAAFVALAEFHCAVKSAMPHEVGVAPAVIARCDRLGALLAGRLQVITNAIRPGDWLELAPKALRVADIARSMVAPFLRHLEQFRATRVAIQPVIRDIWHDHVLFSGENVSGLVDFGAMRCDTVATDVARLLGSLVGDEPEARRVAITAYETVRELKAEESVLIEPLDRSGVLLGAIQWLDWIYCENRLFDDRSAIIARLDTMLVRAELW